MSGAVDVGVVASLGFVLEGGSVDGDTSSLFLRGLVDGSVLNVLGLLFGCQVLGDGGGEGGLAVIDVADGAD